MRARLIRLTTLLVFACSLLLPVTGNALSGSSFQAGRIMDEGVLYNPAGYGVQDIQTFLNSKVSSCDTNGTLPYAGTTAAAYGTSRGYPPPYTCLKDYRADSITKPAEAGLCNGYTGSNQTAAEILYNVGQSCGVNPKALIVLLQKEQGLVTDSWPWSSQYQKATGYGCPDTAACNTLYNGFFNQVYNAARQFKKYARDNGSYNHIAYQTNNVRFSPNASCGSSSVYIQNLATAALYNYTPYQPNQSALNNLYGSGDSCGAYGNRNFWRYYNDWFGSVYSNASVSNIKWSFENLDGGAGAVSGASNRDVGLYNFSITKDSVLHTFYYDKTNGFLRHAWSDATGWHFEVVDGAGGANGQITANVGGYIRAVEHEDKLTVAYFDFTNKQLRVASLETDGWHAETIDGAGGGDNRYTADVGRSIALYSYTNAASITTLQVYYYDATNGNLRHAWKDADGWHFENLDGDYGSVAKWNADLGSNVVIDKYGSSLQLYYFDGTYGNLRHAWSDVNGWHFENLDGDYGSISRQDANTGQDPVFINQSGTLQLFYRNNSRNTLRHAWHDNKGWHFENLDGDLGSISRTNGNVGFNPSVFMYDGIMNLFYYDASGQAVRQAWADSSGWRFAHIDGEYTAITLSNNTMGPITSIVQYGTSAQLFYYDATQKSLRHAWGGYK